MITLKDKHAQEKMKRAGQLLCGLFIELEKYIVAGVTTLGLDTIIAGMLEQKNLISQSKGYLGYRHVSCISINEEVVHGVPSVDKIVQDGDLVKIDICAAWNGYCADMARCFFVGEHYTQAAKKLVDVAQLALDAGIEHAVPGGRLGDISAAIQKTIENHGFGIVRNFAGHGIGKRMHEEPEILNYGVSGRGPILRSGMALALEPMITLGRDDVVVLPDGWTAKTVDGSLAAHVEDTVIITDQGPCIITRMM